MWSIVAVNLPVTNSRLMSRPPVAPLSFRFRSIFTGSLYKVASSQGLRNLYSLSESGTPSTAHVVLHARGTNSYASSVTRVPNYHESINFIRCSISTRTTSSYAEKNLQRYALTQARVQLRLRQFCSPCLTAAVQTDCIYSRKKQWIYSLTACVITR